MSDTPDPGNVESHPIDENSDEESKEEIDLVQKRKAQFMSVLALDDSSDDSDQSDEEDEVQTEPEPEVKKMIKKPTTKTTKSKREKVLSTEEKVTNEIDEEMKLLDSLIQQNKTSPMKSTDPNNNNRTTIAQLLSVETKNLDLDAGLRKRFDDQFSNIDFGSGSRELRRFFEMESGQRSNNRKPTNTSRLYWFGPPKDGWVKPPSMVTGGFALVKVEEDFGGTQWFEVRFSEEFRKLEQQFQTVLNVGDPNWLVVFLVHHPYHPEALLKLAFYFAAVGNVERAIDLVRRVLYCFECIIPRSLRPSEGSCRMVPFRPENKGLFIALYIYMLLCHSKDCPSVATEVCKLLLSLDPCDDNYSLLLLLDTFLLTSKDYSLLSSFYGVCTQCERKEEDVLSDALPNFSFPVMSFPPITSSEYKHQFHVTDLPNWAFSVSLAMFQWEQEDESGKNREGESTATRLLRAAVLKWSFMVEPLFGAALGLGTGVVTLESATGDGESWAAVMAHPLVRTAEVRIPPGSYLHRIRKLYPERAARQWSHEAILRWARSTITGLLREIDTTTVQKHIIYDTKELAKRQIDMYAKLSSPQIPLVKYASPTPAGDQLIPFPIGVLPPDMQALDPMFADPHLLEGGVRFRQTWSEQYQEIERLSRLRSGHTGLDTMLPDDLQHQVEGLLNQLQQVMMGDPQDGAQEVDPRPEERVRGDRLPRRESEGGFLDLSLPLLQLFWMSLFPWVRVRPRR